MPLARLSARVTSHISRSSSRTARSGACRRAGRPLQRRGYSSEGGSHDSHKKGSEWPWALGSAAVTIPSVWYLLQPQLQKSSSHAEGHGHGGHGDGGEHEGEEHEGEDDKKAEENDDGDAKEGDQEDSSDDESGAPSPHPSGDESDNGEDDEGVEEDGKGSGSGVAGLKGKKILKKDSKGGVKKRYESDSGIQLGEQSEDDQDAEGSDMGASSKPVSDMNKTSGKQEGLSNTDTKHSTDITNDSDKSKKGEGVPETAKLKGTVDPNRPAR